MAKYSQVFLKPGKYCVGRNSAGDKVFRDFSAPDLAEYVAGTTGMIQAGYCPPTFLEHKPANTPEGAPIQLSIAEKELQLRNGVGFLINTKVGSDGAVSYQLDIKDKAIAKKLRDGSIKFTSPELREEFTDGAGVTHKKVISHVALTHMPRNIEQGPLVETALQFSLQDAVQFADDEPEKKPEPEVAKAPEPPPETKPENPDLEKSEESPDAQRMQFEALLALFKDVMGVDLPADASDKTLVRDLLTALKTKKACDAAAEASEMEEEEETPEPYEDTGNPMQFSLADCEKPDFTNKLLAKLIKREHAELTGKLDSLVSKGRITSALKDNLTAQTGALQFSAEGEPGRSFTLPQVIDLLDQFTLDGAALDVTQLSTTEESHPAGEDFFNTEPGATLTQEQIDAAVESQKASHPGLFK